MQEAATTIFNSAQDGGRPGIGVCGTKNYRE